MHIDVALFVGSVFYSTDPCVYPRIVPLSQLLQLYDNPWLPGGSEVKASACNAGDVGSIPGSGRSPGEGNGTPLQYSCLENPMDGVDYTVHGVAKSRTRLSDLTN